jgi:hypothetical protein
MRGEGIEPGPEGRLMGEEASDLFAPSGEEVADEAADGVGKEEGLRFAPEVQEEGIDPGDGIKAGTGHAVQAGFFIGPGEENGNSPVGFRAGPGGEAVGGLLLHHEDHVRRKGLPQEGLDPGRGDGVGKIRDNLEGIRALRQPGPRAADSVALEKVERIGKFRT